MFDQTINQVAGYNVLEPKVKLIIREQLESSRSSFNKHEIESRCTSACEFMANLPLQMRDQDIFHLSAATSFVELNTQADIYIDTKWLHHPCLDWYFINKYLFDAGGIVLIVKMYGLRFLDYFGMMPRCSHTLRLMNFGADLFGPKVFQKELFLSRGGISGRLQYSMSS